METVLLLVEYFSGPAVAVAPWMVLFTFVGVYAVYNMPCRRVRSLATFLILLPLILVLLLNSQLTP